MAVVVVTGAEIADGSAGDGVLTLGKRWATDLTSSPRIASRSGPPCGCRHCGFRFLVTSRWDGSCGNGPFSGTRTGGAGREGPRGATSGWRSHREVSLWSFAQRLRVNATPDQRALSLNLTLDRERKFPLYPDSQVSPQRASGSSGF